MERILRSATASLILFSIAFPALLLLTQCRTFDPSADDFDPLNPVRVPAKISFNRDIRPILEIKCLECHNHVNAPKHAGLNLETRELAMTTGHNAPVIKPGDPKNSLFIQVLELNHAHPTNMPPTPDKIWGTRMKILKKWIRQGAEWPANARLIRPQDWDL